METKSKPRRRVANKARYQKNLATKKREKAKKQAKSVSRSVRSYARTQISKFPRTDYYGSNKSVLIVLHDNKETDRILFQVNNIGKGSLYLSLPVLQPESLGIKAPVDTVEWMEAIKKYAKEQYGVEPTYVHDAGEFILLTNSKTVERISGLCPVTVKSIEDNWRWDLYGYNAYLNGNSTCTYVGKQIKEFLLVHGDVAKIYVRHETLEAIMRYRLWSGRLTEFKDEEQGGERNAG